MLFSLRRYAHDPAAGSHTNTWVADLTASAEIEGLHSVVLPAVAAGAESTIYCVYPGQRDHSFFSDVPFWIFCGTQHVGQGRHHDVYPYFQAPVADGPCTLYVMVAPTLEMAKSKIPDTK